MPPDPDFRRWIASYCFASPLSSSGCFTSCVHDTTRHATLGVINFAYRLGDWTGVALGTANIFCRTPRFFFFGRPALVKRTENQNRKPEHPAAGTRIAVYPCTAVLACELSPSTRGTTSARIYAVTEPPSRDESLKQAAARCEATEAFVVILLGVPSFVPTEYHT